MLLDRSLKPYARSTPPETCLQSLVAGLRRGTGFARKLSEAERLVLALTATEPHAFLTLNSASMTRLEATNAWRLLVQRLHRHANSRASKAYFGLVANNHGPAGAHLHMLLGDYLRLDTLTKHATAVGFGQPWVAKVPGADDDPDGLLDTVAYVVGQQTPVFGTEHHLRHQTRETNAWSFMWRGPRWR